MNVTAIIQARLNSTRLPHKVMLGIPEDSNRTCLERVIERVKEADLVNDIILTTPDVELGLIAAGNYINYSVYHGKRNVLKEFMIVNTGNTYQIF